ncbi:hypothetical protein EWM64_g5696 [Hericium alpestre]|uniref:Uncharacterized protein n=1 Tax=Hericium alpestre TaxID=135208 RepID=A0A4Y9ZVU4_9AGAM|nr:hypothetical protein EWM64_g5696 [Hericium alpestre]
MLSPYTSLEKHVMHCALHVILTLGALKHWEIIGKNKWERCFAAEQKSLAQAFLAIQQAGECKIIPPLVISWMLEMVDACHMSRPLEFNSISSADPCLKEKMMGHYHSDL